MILEAKKFSGNNQFRPCSIIGAISERLEKQQHDTTLEIFEVRDAFGNKVPWHTVRMAISRKQGEKTRYKTSLNKDNHLLITKVKIR